MRVLSSTKNDLLQILTINHLDLPNIKHQLPTQLARENESNC